MANQFQNSTLTEQVRQHGEMLARLTTIVEEDHEDLRDLKKSTEIIAKAVAKQEISEISRESARARIMTVVIPLLSTFAGALAGHFIH